MDRISKSAWRLCLPLATTLLAASSAWAANCHDERTGSGVPTGPAFWNAMQFTDGGIVSGYGRVIYAVGAIEAATVSTQNGKTTLHYTAFESFLKANNVKAGALIVFHSPGGDVSGGFALGQAIRANSFRTTVGQPQAPNASSPLKTLGSAAPIAGECDSACSMAFLGGVFRTVPTGSLYGVHAAEQGGTSPIEPQGANFYSGEQTAAATSAYLERMGIDPSWLRMAEACAAGFDMIQYLTPAQLAKTKTITSFATSWSLSDQSGAIVVEADNPDSSGIPNNHDDLVFTCAGTPRGVQMRIDYLPEAYNAGESGGGVRAAPADFIKMVSGYSLSAAKAATKGSSPQPAVVDIAQSQIVAPLTVSDTHHVTTTIAVPSSLGDVLKQYDTVQFSFNKHTSPVGQVRFQLSAEGHQFINDYSAACR